MNEYQYRASSTALYPNHGRNIVYPTLGLVGEAGEIANKVKKIERDDGGVLTDEKRQIIAKELGDALWYVSQIASEIGYTLDGIAQQNLDKLASRQQRGTLHGDGDNR